MIIYVSIDIEGTGDNLKYPISNIGFCVGDSDGKIHQTERIDIKVDKSEIEQRCWDEFWSKYPGLWEKLQKNAIETRAAALKCYRFLYSIELKYQGQKVQFITDCPDYDIARIDNMLFKELGCNPLRFDSENKRRWAVDPSERAEGLGEEGKRCYARVKEMGVKHSHDPVEDATFNYYLYLETLKVTEKLNKVDFSKLEL